MGQDATGEHMRMEQPITSTQHGWQEGVIALLVAVTLMILLLDLVTPLGMAVGALYVLPVLATVWLPDPRAGLWMAGVGSVLIVLGAAMSPGGALLSAVAFNRSISILVLWGAALFLWRQRAVSAQLESAQAQLSGLIQLAQDAIISIDTSYRIVLFNHGAERIFGYTAAEVLGQPLDQLLPTHVGTAHREHLRRFAAAAEVSRRMGERQEVRGRRRGGEEFPAEAAISKVQVDEQLRFTVVLRDITARKDAERRLAVVHEITSILAEATDEARLMPHVLYVLGERLGWQAAAYWAPDASGQGLRCCHFWSAEPAAFRGFEAQTRIVAFPSGVGLPGRVWASGQASWIPDLALDSNFPRSVQAEAGRLRSGFAFPVSFNKDLIGVVECFSGHTSQPAPQLLQMLSSLGGQIGQVLDRLATHRKLEASEQRFRAIVRSYPDCVKIVTREGTILSMNPAGLALLGVDDEQMVMGQAMTQFVHMEDQPAVQDWLTEIGQGGPPTILFRMQDHGGQVHWMESTGVVLTQTAERVEDFLVIAQDVTERRSAEARIQESEARLQAMLDHSPACIFLKDLEGRYLLVNRSFEQLLGRSGGSPIGKTDEELFGPTYVAALRAHDAAVLAAGQPMEFEEEIDDGAGGRINQVHKFPLRDAAGRIYALGGIATDLTASRRLEVELRQAQKMEAIGRLAGGIAHDFNNMLMVILGYGQMLQEKLAADDRRRALVEQVVQAGQRASLLTGQLLAFSRKQRVQPKPLDVNDTLAKMDPMLRRLIGEQITFVVSPGPPGMTILADPSHLDQVLLNLAVNARDAMPQGGQLTIGVGTRVVTGEEGCSHGTLRPGSYVWMRVTDMGEGMDAATLACLFEPYFTTKPQGRGTGLGLAMVYGIVQEHQGVIDLVSQPKQGTVVTVYFPQMPEPASGAAAETVAPVWRRGTETVLLVEDEVDVRAWVRTVLSEQGYTVVEAQDGMQAIQRFQQHPGPIHLLVTDMVMPEMSGPEVVARLEPQAPALRVLYMSGYTEHPVFKDGGQETGRAFLQKPISREDLLEKVRALLESPEA